MYLSAIAILALRGLDRETKHKLAGAIGTSPTTLYRWIQENRNNGPLTTMGAQKIIGDLVKLPVLERELLTTEIKKPEIEKLWQQ